MAEVTHLVQGQDGGKQLEVCTFVREESENQSVDTGSKITLPIAASAGAPAETQTRMCQDYKAMQPQVRTCQIWDCVYYVAIASGGWFTLKKVLIVVGVVGAVVFTAGAGAVLLGGAAIAGTAGTAIAVGGGAATVGFGGASVISGDVDDYSRGAELGRNQIKKCGNWANNGVPVPGEKVGAPHAC